MEFINSEKTNKTKLVDFINKKIEFAKEQKQIAIKNEDGSDVYWEGVSLTCSDILNFIAKL